MQLPTISSPFLHGGSTVSAVMLRVCLAMLPGIVFYVYYFGYGLLINMLIACTFAILSESLVLTIRGRPLGFYLKDCSALVTGLLFAMAIPPLTPWWITALGSSFAVIIVKQLFGGLGQNIFNPAMAGYAMVLLSYPKAMTAWSPPQGIANETQHQEQISSIIHGISDDRFDALTQATPLDVMHVQLGLGNDISTVIQSPLFGHFAGLGWEMVNLGFLIGGIWLIYKRIITWHIPAGLLLTLTLLSLVFYLIDSTQFVSPLFHLFNGAVMLGAFFIATDPVTAPSTAKGKFIFGAGIAAIIFVIRTWGGYPDGVAFGVLIMNMVTPLLDQLTQPRVFGHKHE